MNCAQNEKKGAARKKVKRLASAQGSRNTRVQQQGRGKRGVNAGANLRPLKVTAAKASSISKRPAKALGAKPVKPKPKVAQVDHDDSDTNSVASTSRAKRTPAKGKLEETETPDKKAVKKADGNEGGDSAKKGTLAGPADAAPKKKVTKVVRKLVAKNNIQKNKLKSGNQSILRYLKPVGKAKQPGEIVKSKTKWVVALKGGTKAASRRSQGVVPGEGRCDSPTTTRKLKSTPVAAKKKREDEGSSEKDSEPMEVFDEGLEADAVTAESPPTPADGAKKPAVRKSSISGKTRLTRSQGGDRILRNGKSSKAKKILKLADEQLADARKRRSKTDEDVKSPVGEDVSRGEPENPEEGDSQREAVLEEPDVGVPEASEPEQPEPVLESPVHPEPVVDEPKVSEPVQQPTFHPVSPFTPDEEVTRFPKGEEAEVEPKAAVAVTTPLSPVSPVANSILSNKNFTDTNSNVCTNNVKENRKPSDAQPIKTVDIINDIHTDWDSDEDAQGSVRDGKIPFGNSSPAQVTKENEAPKYNILSKPPNRQLVSTPPLLEPDKPKIEEKTENSPSDSRNVGMKMPPTTECLLKTKEVNGFADSVEMLAKRTSKIDFELLRRRTKRSMSLNVDPNDKLTPTKRTYGAAKPRDTIRMLVSMPKLSPEVDLPVVKSPSKNVSLADKSLPKSEELFDNLIAGTKDETNETDDSEPQETALEKEDEVVGAPNGTCDEEDKKDIVADEMTSSTPVVSPSPPLPAELVTDVETVELPEEEREELKQDDEVSVCSEKRSDDFSLHLTVDSVEDNSMDKQLDTETMDSEIADLPKDDEEEPSEEVQKPEGAVSLDENSSENPLSPPKLKPFDSDSIIDEEEIMAEMVATPEESKEEAVTESKEEVAEPKKEDPAAEHKEEDNSNLSEASEGYIQKYIESQEEVEPIPTEGEPKTEEGDPTKEVAEQVTSLEGELTTPKDPEIRTDVQLSARIDSKETCGSSASSLSSILDADTTRLNLDLNLAEIEKKRREILEEEESPERRAVKEHVLNSLGLQSLRSVAEAAALSTSGTSRSAKRAQRKDSGGASASSGRLKVVINVPKEKSKPLRMLFKNGKPYPSHPEAMPLQSVVTPEAETEEGDVELKNTPALANVEGNGTVDAALLSLVDYRPNILPGPDAAGGVDADNKNKQPGSLVIPEKSSSFSIHPGRLCSDVCSYCFGKFGSLDTPCHIAQLKSRERQMKILSVETQLAMDSCLCDACIRYVDRKANCPSYKPPGGRRERNKYSGTQAVCCVNGCPQSAVHSLRKKWYFKIRKSVALKCPVNLDLVNPQLPLPLCAEHYSYMDYFMVCGLCKRRLTRSHMYNLTEVREINLCLEADGIPARLSDKLFVCKLCRYYATMRVKHPRSHFTLSSNQREFFNSYRKRILRNHDIAVSGSEDNGEGDPELPKDRSVSPAGDGSCNEEHPKGKRRRARSNPTPPSTTENLVAVEVDPPKKKARTSAASVSKSKDKAEQSDSERTDADKVSAKSQPPLRLCLSNVTTNSQSGSAEWVRKELPPFFPGEDQLALHANIEFQEDTPSDQKEWQRCTSTLQFDKETKRLWQELQRPYGSQSSFIRHLVLMERYWRQGELTLTATTDRANTYTRSVQNRLKAYGTTYVSKKPQAVATPPPPSAAPPPAKPEEKPAVQPEEKPVPVKPAAPEKPATPEKPTAPPQPAPPAPAPPPQLKVVLPRLQPKPPAAKQPKTATKAPVKQQKILPKPLVPPTSVWEPIAKNASPNRPFFVSTPPVVNLTSSVSLTAVPVPGVSPVPGTSTVNEPAVVGTVRTSKPSSWAGGFVSIVTSASQAPGRVSTSPNVSASITPIFSTNPTNSVSASVSPTLPLGAGLRVDGKVPGNQSSKSQHLVQVTAGGKSFSLTISQFKKLQALRQQRQIDQQKKVRRTTGAVGNKPKQRRPSVAAPPKECIGTAEPEPNPQESFVPMICDVRSVTSSDQAIRMWDEPDRTEECKLNPQLEITPIEAPPCLPKISKDLSVTHISSEMTLTTLVPSRALAADAFASTAIQPPATVTAPGPAMVLVPSISPSVVQPIAPLFTPAVPVLPVAPVTDILPAGVDTFPN